MGAEWPCKIPAGFLQKKHRTKGRLVSKANVNLKENLLNIGSSPRKIWVPQAQEPVHTSSDQQPVPLTEVKCSDTFVDGENFVVTWCPELRYPAQLDLLGLTFIAGLSDLTQLPLSVGRRQHTASGKNREKAFYHKAMTVDLFGASLSRFQYESFITHTEYTDILAFLSECLANTLSHKESFSEASLLGCLMFSTELNYCTL